MDSSPDIQASRLQLFQQGQHEFHYLLNPDWIDCLSEPDFRTRRGLVFLRMSFWHNHTAASQPQSEPAISAWEAGTTYFQKLCQCWTHSAVLLEIIWIFSILCNEKASSVIWSSKLAETFHKKSVLFKYRFSSTQRFTGLWSKSDDWRNFWYSWDRQQNIESKKYCKITAWMAFKNTQPGFLKAVYFYQVLHLKIAI